MTSLTGPTRSSGSEAKLTGAIITGLPITFHCARRLSSESFSHSSCRSPVIVRVRVADRRVGVRRREGGLLDLLRPVGAQVEHADLGELAELQPAEEPVAVAQLRRTVHPHRHPLVERAVGARPAPQVVALVGLVVLGAAPPLVVGDLVVVPGDDPGELRVRVLEVGVGLVLRVALPVVGEGHHLPRRVVRPDVHLALAVAVLPGGVLVEVVAEVQHRVQVVAGGQAAVGAEPAGLPVGAGDDAEAEVLGQRVGRGRGPGAAGAAGDAGAAEPVEVPARRRQPVDVDLDRVVAPRGGLDRAAGVRRRGSRGRGPPARSP